RCAFTEASLFFSSRRRHTRSKRDWSSDVCSSDLVDQGGVGHGVGTDRAHHVDLRAELGGGHGLVSALAAGADLTTATQQGFAGRSEERRVGKECSKRGETGAQRT